MSRDLKPRRQNKTAGRRKSGGGTLLGLFIGLVIGVLAAAAVVWYINKTPVPFTTRQAPPPASNARPQGTAPLPLPGKPGDPAPQGGDKPRFDFYKILPGDAEAIPDPKPADPKAKPSAEAPPKEALYLQAGSFQNAGDADNQKARLAMLGVEASIQQVMLQDKVWYRVRLGPFTKIDDLNRTRTELAKQGVEASVVKKD
jgi:cell division protein FtsN